jgi:hypothetical protein
MKVATPDDVEASARSAVRQFDRLGIKHRIVPEKLRAAAEQFAAARAAPASRGDVADLKEMIAALAAEVRALRTHQSQFPNRQRIA